MWEMTPDRYKALKTSRAAFKIECFSNSNGTEGKLGYLIVPLKEIRFNDTQSSWVSMLQPPKLARPELLLRTRVMRADDYYREVAELQARCEKAAAAAAAGKLPSPAIPASPEASENKELNESVIEIGAEGGFELRLGLSIDSVRGLESLGPASSGALYFYYQLFDADIRSAPFKSASDFKSEKRTFLLSSAKADLVAYFSQPLELFLCRGAKAIGVVKVPSCAALAERWFRSRVSEALVDSFDIRPIESISAARGGRHASVTITVELESSGRMPVAVSAPAPVAAAASASSERAMQNAAAPMTAEAPSMASPAASPIRSSTEQSLMIEPMRHDYTLSEDCSSLARHSVNSSAAPRHAPLAVGPEYAKLFKIVIEVTSFKNLLPSHVLRSVLTAKSLTDYLNTCSEETWLYARFEYPLLFGEAHVFSNPTEFVKRTNEGRSMTVVQKPQVGGALFSFEFAMSERNLNVALQEASLGVEIWRMHSPPASASSGGGGGGSRKASHSSGDEFVGIAVVPLSVVKGEQSKRQSLGDGEISHAVEDSFAVLPEVAGDMQRPAVGHVGMRVQLNDLGPFETARTRDQQLREQLETTRAKVEELWEECQKETKRAEKLETRLLVAEFEEQMASTQDKEEMCKARKVHVERMRQMEESLREQKRINNECIEMLEEAERTAVMEAARRSALEKENAELRARLGEMEQQHPVRPPVKRLGSMGSPLLRKAVRGSQMPLLSPGKNRSINHSLNVSENYSDTSNMSSAPEAELQNF